MSRLRQIVLLAGNDLRLTLRDRASLVWMLLLPVAMMWIFGNVSRERGPSQATLYVEDRDGGWLAEAFVAELAGDRLDLREVKPDSPAERPRTLVIPKGFTEGALAGRQQVLRIEKAEGSNQTFSLAAEAYTVRAIVRSVGRLAELGQEGANQESFAALARRPPLVSVAVSTAGEGRPVPSGFSQSVPGILTMTVLMMTLIYGGVFLTLEKRQGMIRRQATLPLGRGTIFLGKLAGRLLIAALQIGVLLLAGRFLFGVSWGSSPLGLLLAVSAFAFAVASLSTLLGALLNTPEQASAVGWLGSMVFAALGGCWWPAEVMPRALWQVAHVLPTAWAMDAFHALISYGHGAEAVVLPAAVLTGFGVVFSALGARFLRVG